LCVNVLGIDDTSRPLRYVLALGKWGALCAPQNQRRKTMSKNYARFIIRILFYLVGIAIKEGITLDIYVNIAVSVA
jgi:hypothetical protein